MPQRLTGLFRNGHHSTISQQIYLDALTLSPSLVPTLTSSQDPCSPPNHSTPLSSPPNAPFETPPTNLSPTLFHALLTKYSSSPCIHEQERAILLTALAMRAGAHIEEADFGVVRRVVEELKGWIAGSVRDEVLDAVSGYGNDGVGWRFGEGSHAEGMVGKGNDGAWHDGLEEDEHEKWAGDEEGIELREIKSRPSSLPTEDSVLEGQAVREPLSKLDAPGSNVPHSTDPELASSNTGFTASEYGLEDDDELESAIEPDLVVEQERVYSTTSEEDKACDIVPSDTTVDASTPAYSPASHCIPIDDFEDSGYMSNEYEASILTISSPCSKVPVLGSSPLRHTSIEASPSQTATQNPIESSKNNGHPQIGNDRESSISDTSDESSIESTTLSNALRPPRSPSPPIEPKSLGHEMCFERGLSDDHELPRTIKGRHMRQKSRRISRVESITNLDDENGEEAWTAEGYRTSGPGPKGRLAGAPSIFRPMVTKPKITNIQRISRPLRSRRAMKGSISATNSPTPISSLLAQWSKRVERPSIVPSPPSPINESGVSYQFSDIVEISSFKPCSSLHSSAAPPPKTSEVVTICSFSDTQQLDRPSINTVSQIVEIYSSSPSCLIDSSPGPSAFALSEIVEIYSAKADNGFDKLHGPSKEELAASDEHSSVANNVPWCNSSSDENTPEGALSALIWACLIFGIWIAGVVLFLELMRPL